MSTGQKVVLIDKIDVSPGAKQVNGPSARASHWKYKHETPARGIGLS